MRRASIVESIAEGGVSGPPALGEAIDELEELADALPFLVARDGDVPAMWLSSSFAAQVAAIRSRIATVANPGRLVARLGHAADAGYEARGRFESAARRLARDPDSVAVAIRWLEVTMGVRLPSWPEVLRRGAIEVRP